MHDTAGNETFRSIAPQFYRVTDIACLVYDITNLDSFESIQKWMKEIRQYANNVEMILIANKCDKANDQGSVSLEGRQYAERNYMRFIEMSAIKKEDFGKLDDILKEAVSKVIARGGGTRTTGVVELQPEATDQEQNQWFWKRWGWC